jgi:6-pyruvoyltetrahydropterin/6-carboxytetrahydropterin synthase
MHNITRKYDFAAAHRIEGHPKCGRLHGHNYTVIVELSADDTEYGMVMDYNDMDAVFKPIVDAFDHRYIVSRENRGYTDPYAELALRNGHAIDLPMVRSTAECLAEHLFEMCSAALARTDTGAQMYSVTVIEAPKSTATYRL